MKTKHIHRRAFIALASTSILALAACNKQPTTNAAGQPVIRFGHFPNITHL